MKTHHTNKQHPPSIANIGGTDRTVIAPVSVVEHLSRCSGCKRLVRIGDVAAYLGVPLATAYKWASRGHPAYPHTARLPNRQLSTRCADVHNWLEERAS